MYPADHFANNLKCRLTALSKYIICIFEYESAFPHIIAQSCEHHFRTHFLKIIQDSSPDPTHTLSADAHY